LKKLAVRVTIHLKDGHQEMCSQMVVMTYTSTNWALPTSQTLTSLVHQNTLNVLVAPASHAGNHQHFAFLAG